MQVLIVLTALQLPSRPAAQAPGHAEVRKLQSKSPAAGRPP